MSSKLDKNHKMKSTSMITLSFLGLVLLLTMINGYKPYPKYVHKEFHGYPKFEHEPKKIVGYKKVVEYKPVIKHVPVVRHVPILAKPKKKKKSYEPHGWSHDYSHGW
jgi:hypothetical protein